MLLAHVVGAWSAALVLALAFGFTVHYEFLPRLPHSTTCRSMGVKIEEAQWVEDLGCMFNTKLAKTCTNCSLWPNQCCDPGELVNRGICLHGTMTFGKVANPTETNSLEILCEEELINCMKENRPLLLPNATFKCYASETDPTPTLTESSIKSGFIVFCFFFALVELGLVCCAVGCCECQGCQDSQVSQESQDIQVVVCPASAPLYTDDSKNSEDTIDIQVANLEASQPGNIEMSVPR